MAVNDVPGYASFPPEINPSYAFLSFHYELAEHIMLLSSYVKVIFPFALQFNVPLVVYTVVICMFTTI